MAATVETVAKVKKEKPVKYKKMPNLRQQDNITGWLFISPFVFGFIMFMLVPLCQSLWYSMCDTTVGLGGITTVWNNFQNYYEAFRGAATTFPDQLKNAVLDILWQTPVIVIFSMFIALILNQKFRGRVFARAVFFLPVIVTSGIVIQIMNQDSFSESFKSGEAASSMMMTVGSIEQLLYDMGFSSDIVEMFISVANNIFNITWKSGVQILLFLAGLQSVPGSLYEAASVEGATGWETFWKITFPMITPQLVIVATYTIVDTFTDYGNEVIQNIYTTAFTNIKYGLSSAMAWAYFLVVLAILGIINWLLGKITFYMVD